jgi:hypothetical protein
MAFAHLKRETIGAIKQAFAAGPLHYDDGLRGLLLDGTGYSADLKNYKTENTQLAGDLKDLNTIAVLNDAGKTIPLKRWLENARDQFGRLPNAEVFVRALNEMTVGPADTSDTATIVDALDALSDLIRKNDFAYDAVLFYRKIFTTASREFEVINDYKLMHDALHKLQLGWPNMADMIKLTSFTAMQITIGNYSSLFQTTVGELGKIYEKGFVDGSEKTWMTEFGQTQTSLDDAIDSGDSTTIEEIFDDVKNRLARQLSLLNSRLKAAISSLHLKDLIKSMSDLCEVLREVAPQRADKQVEQYASGVIEITKLDEELSQLIKQHDDWQQADNVLRTLGLAIGSGTGPESMRDKLKEDERLHQLKLIVTVIDLNVSPLLVGKTSRAAKGLMNSADRLKALIEQKDSDNAERAFDGYREQAMHFFFSLDTEMKAKCDELRQIGEGLRQVNDELVATSTEV